MDRRNFIKKTAAAGVSAATTALLAETSALARESGGGGTALKRRKLGKTGERLSIIGFGGIVVSGIEQTAANNLVHEAIERGVNYFDVAPTYGNAQERLGNALVGKRSRIFLACKTTQRKRAEASQELEESLRLLKTDHVDLYQLHGLTTMEELNQCFATGGAMEAVLQAQDQGKLRHIGFSAHSVETALAALDRFKFDTVLFPINFVLYTEANFGPQVLARAKRKGMGCLALKAMARTVWSEDPKRQEYAKCWYEPITDPGIASLALRFTLSEGVTAAIPPGDERLFRLALDAAEKFKPLTEQERKDLCQNAKGLKPIFTLEA
ncbi:MAG: aldo/keto reductase [Armatimonadetes bacterium]|nr:aldo/keto reductase [Armatimonadota bacterium]